jgi:threonine/homoserine/homoserine lactone efflux protein
LLSSAAAAWAFFFLVVELKLSWPILPFLMLLSAAYFGYLAWKKLKLRSRESGPGASQIGS